MVKNPKNCQPEFLYEYSPCHPRPPETKYSIEDIIYYKPGENFFDSIPFSLFRLVNLVRLGGRGR